MRCERIALPTEPYPHGQFTNSIIINTQKKCKHNYINRFTNFNCYGKIFFTWRHGSAGRAFASHARGHRFESCCLHHNKSPSIVMGFYYGKNILRARTRKLVFGVRRLLATACVMQRVYLSSHFVSFRNISQNCPMPSSPVDVTFCPSMSIRYCERVLSRGREPGDCLQTLALYSVFILADTLCRLVVNLRNRGPAGSPI